MSIVPKFTKCDRADCAMPARWQIVIDVTSAGARAVRESVLTNLVVCSGHKATTTVDEVLDDDAKALVRRHMSATIFPEPDFSTAKLGFIQMVNGKQVNPDRFREAKVVTNEERRTHQCRHDNCDSEAIWQAHLILLGSPLKGDTTIKVCAAHLKAAEAFLQNDQNRERLVKLLMDEGHGRIPARDIVVEFRRIEADKG
ncbi:MAG: hypothetical protein EPO02_13295 [Nitrospirae bacterium]|nr:MAG: hypothetical protein EPO02_13295 [Nitrospirota bacterium]